MRIGIAQINPTVGDLHGNRDQILSAYRKLVDEGAELVVFPELAITGFPPRDLLQKQRFGADSEGVLLEIAAATGQVPALVGTLEQNPSRQGRAFFNAAALCQQGEIKQLCRKCLLPAYDGFDEDRYFEAARAPSVVTIAGHRIGITIGEDIWDLPPAARQSRYHFDPVSALAGAKIDLMINLSASPWHVGKSQLRDSVLRATAKKLRCDVVYVNAVGGNDELVFDGQSLVMTKHGIVTDCLPAFVECASVVDVLENLNPTTPAPSRAPGTDENQIADVFTALTLGLRDYARKSGFPRCLVALNGGLNSAVVAAIAAAALGPTNVRGVSLPSAIFSPHSRDDATDLARRLGIEFDPLSIETAVAAAESALASAFRRTERDLTAENLPACTCDSLMMALSNKFSALLLSTGNKSETAVGCHTLYGDTCGGLAVISDLFKTQVFALARWINRDLEVIPWPTINKRPSAELSSGQTDEDKLPAADVLDAILRDYAEAGLSIHDLVSRAGVEINVNEMGRKVDLNGSKRRQSASGLKITPLAFGVGRPIPFVQRYLS